MTVLNPNALGNLLPIVQLHEIKQLIYSTRFFGDNEQQ